MVCSDVAALVTGVLSGLALSGSVYWAVTSIFKSKSAVLPDGGVTVNPASCSGVSVAAPPLMVIVSSAVLPRTAPSGIPKIVTESTSLMVLTSAVVALVVGAMAESYAPDASLAPAVAVSATALTVTFKVAVLCRHRCWRPKLPKY